MKTLKSNLSIYYQLTFTKMLKIYSDRFMEDLQTEVQELEFHEFSKGLDFISQVDFAKILLRYTYLQSEE
jgi:hypothetical protein